MRRVEIDVPDHIRDPQRYFNRTVQHWHTVVFSDDDLALDIDLAGFCDACSHPIYLIEAAESERKATAKLTQLARQSGVAGFLIVHQNKVVLGGRRIYPAPRTAWLEWSPSLGG